MCFIEVLYQICKKGNVGIDSAKGFWHPWNRERTFMIKRTSLKYVFSPLSLLQPYGLLWGWACLCLIIIVWDVGANKRVEFLSWARTWKSINTVVDRIVTPYPHILIPRIFEYVTTHGKWKFSDDSIQEDSIQEGSIQEDWILEMGGLLWIMWISPM
jgi:hypothetical protein